MSLDIERVAGVFVDVADTLVADFDLIDFLHSFAGHAAEISGGAAAGVMLIGPDGVLHHVGASSKDAHVLELFQVQADEGPCLDSIRTGEPVVVADLSVAADRWPSFAERALQAGVRSVHAFPLRLRDEVIGGLNIFEPADHELRPEEMRVLQALADLATIALIQEQAVARAEMVTEQLQVALNSRIVVEQAKGVVARTLGVSVDEAFERLRLHARSQRRRLTDVAHEVVSSGPGPDLLRRP